MNKHSTVLILPAAYRAAGNAVAQAMGWGPDNYSVPLSATGTPPASHFGLHAWTSDEFKGWLEGTEALPAGMQSAAPVIAALTASFRMTDNAADHFREAIAAKGLAVIVYDTVGDASESEG